ncbi:MAG: TGS domain-containing protein [Candidatus Bathyarchaeota archaeon]|nr:TGS domain-containing protein [Candidatus Bathyarchaeota archaeon]
MVTNLPAEAKAKWAEVVACHSTPQKIKLMREFISLVPKHKGTSKLLANIRHRIATLERDLEKSKARKKGRRGRSFSVPKEGAGQIIILGPTNVGRSSLLASVTNAKVEVTPIYYATRKPVVGMLPYRDVQFQLVEAPALVEGASDGKMEGPQILGLARNADGLMVMVDLSRDPVEEFRMTRSELEQAGIMIVKSEGEVEVTRRSLGAGVQVVGGGVIADGTLEDVRKLLNGYRISSALVRIRGNVTLDGIESSLFSSSIYKPTIVVANKMDAPGAGDKLRYIKEVLKGEDLSLLPVSCRKKRGLEELGNLLFQMLGIIRVYTKQPGAKERSEKPVVVEDGTTVIDAAKKLHSKLYRKFRYARVWGPSAKYPGQKVGSNHLLKDGDAIEIH